VEWFGELSSFLEERKQRLGTPVPGFERLRRLVWPQLEAPQ